MLHESALQRLFFPHNFSIFSVLREDCTGCPHLLPWKHLFSTIHGQCLPLFVLSTLLSRFPHVVKNSNPGKYPRNRNRTGWYFTTVFLYTLYNYGYNVSSGQKAQAVFCGRTRLQHPTYLKGIFHYSSAMNFVFFPQSNPVCNLLHSWVMPHLISYYVKPSISFFLSPGLLMPQLHIQVRRSYLHKI